MKIGELIKKIKYESEWNQTQIANYLGCTQATVSRMRHHMQIPSTHLVFRLIKLAKKYNIEVKVEDLFEKD